jgi:hypothetical protein
VNLSLKSALCEDCKAVTSSYFMPAEKKPRWCAGCAKAHAGAISRDRSSSKCEDCTKVYSTFGYRRERKKRWCAGCAKAHGGAANLAREARGRCEDCRKVRPDRRALGVCAVVGAAVGTERVSSRLISRVRVAQAEATFGLKSDGKRRWCRSCAQTYKGSENLRNNHARCEDCKVKQPTFGMPKEGKRRWCGVCSKAHEGAEGIKRKMCEDCHTKQPRYGLPAEGNTRWCAGCAKKHRGTENVGSKKVRPRRRRRRPLGPRRRIGFAAPAA